MKKFLLLLCALLSTAGAWAEEITLSPSSGSYSASGNYTNVWTVSSSTPALTFTASANNMDKRQTGEYLLWHSGSAQTSTYTITVPDGYKIVSYVITGTANSNDQTLTAGSVTATFTSSVSNSFTVTGLSDASTAFTLTGANTGLKITAITVTVEENTSYVPFDPTNVDGKTFTMQCARGYIYGNGTKIAGTINKDQASKFAIVTYKSETYLYDATNKAFVCHTEDAKAGTSGNVALESTNDFSKIVKGLSFGNTNITNYPYYLADSWTNWLNMDGGKNVYMNTWTNFEGGNGGNTYKIEYVDMDFDDTEAVAALQDYFDPTPESVFAKAIAELEAINWGTGLNQYSLVIEGTDYTTQAASIISGLKTAGYSADNLTMAQQMLANYALNMPAANTFFRIRSILGDKPYLTAPAADGRATFTAATDNSTVFFLTEDNYLVSLSTGLGFKNVYQGAADIMASGIDGNLFSVIAAVSGNKGQYSVTTKVKGNITYLYSTGANNSNADRNTYSAGWVNQNSFTLEAAEVTTLPVAISAAGYATFCAPVAVTVPAGVTANTVAINADGVHLDLNPVTTIPAGTAVILEGAEGTYNFAIDATNTDAALTSALTGVSAAIAAPVGSYVLQNQKGVVGFYQVDSEQPKVGGFRAYIPAQGGSVKAFFFGGADAIEAIGNGQGTMDNAAIYNVAGQRISNLRRGINIVGGKKVVVK